MKYSIVSGNHNTPLPFMEMWLQNTFRFSKPEQVLVIGDSDSKFCDSEIPYIRIPLIGNLGGFMQLLNGEKPHHFNGWTGVVLAGAMLCYCNETDMVYKESDCLMFGDCIGKMYEEIGEAGIIFGRRHQSSPWMPCSQSLFLLKHSYIREFMIALLSQPAQNTPDTLGEHLFVNLMEKHPDKWKMMSFGVDRERPLPISEKVFYAQQLTDDELNELKAADLI